MMTEDRPYAGILMNDGTEISHYGVKGMKWGKRMFGTVKKLFGKPETKSNVSYHFLNGKDKNSSYKSNSSKSGRVKTKTYTVYDDDRRPIDKKTVTYTNADKGRRKDPTKIHNATLNALNKKKKWF